MVDLREALRPFVEDAAAGPRRSVAEVAERAGEARRRRVRRRSVVAGLAVVVVAASAAVMVRGSRHPADDVSTVEPAVSTSSTAVPDTTATTDTTDTTATTVPPSSTEAPSASTLPPTTGPATGDRPLVPLVDGVEAASTTTSSWEDGYCIEVRVDNTTSAPVVWQVRYRFAGAIATFWNAVVDDQGDGSTVFTGDAVNRELAPGASTTFGTCIDT